MARKTIIQLRLEVHVPDAQLEPEDLLNNLIGLFGSEVEEHGGMLLVVRTNAYLEPEQDTELPMLPDPPPVFPATSLDTE